MTVATITSKGQVTIPKGVRAMLGIKAGDRIDFVMRGDGTVVVRPCVTDLDDVHGMLVTSKKVSIEEMDKAIGAFRSKRGKK